MTTNKKKYKITGWSITNIMSGTSGPISQLQFIVTSIIGILSAGTWYQTNSTYAMFVGLSGILLDKVVLGGLSVEESV